MTSDIVLRGAAFAERDDELRRINAEIAAFQASRPSPWSFPVDVVRAARRQGLGVFPGLSPDPDAVDTSLPLDGGRAIPVRILRPSDGRARGTYLHFHGGGWVFGEAVENDPRLRRLADATGLCVASVDYRLAPEHPFPAGPDDCEASALALAAGRLADLPTGFLAIGGESAGAHLSALTLLRLRDRHGLAPFHAANLVAGCFDLSLTPSVRRFGPERLILNSEDVGELVRRFLGGDADAGDPAISPLHARLDGLPPALFTVGTRDLLLDDTMFMSARWLAAGNAAELFVQPDGCHVYETFASEAGTRSETRMADFLNRQVERVAASGPTSALRPAPIDEGRRVWQADRMNQSALIFKLSPRSEWLAAEAAGRFSGAPVDVKDGYIHFSTAEQVRETAARHFAGEGSLIIVAVDPEKLGPALKWEPSRGGDLFPHLYGELSMDAVVYVADVPLGTDGVHRFPGSVR